MSAMLQGTYNGRAFTRTAASQVQCLSNTLPNIIAVMCNCKHCLLVWFPRGSLRPNPLCECTECYRGIHSSCLGENGLRTSCLVCIVAVRRNLEFPQECLTPSVPTSPAARLVVLVVLLAVGFLLKKKNHFCIHP